MMRRCFQNHGPWMVLLFAVLVAMTGCKSAPSQKVAADGIRSRADQAFDDLSDAETGRPARQRQPQMGEAAPAPETPPVQSVPSTGGKRPDWVTGASARYPADRFLSAVGYGNDRPGAEDKARAEIAKIFHSEIDASNRTIQTIMESSSGGRTQSAERVDFEEIINISTNKILSGVRIAEVYGPSKNESVCYALAVLDRYQAKTILTSKIDDLDRDIRQLLEETDRQPDPLLRIKLLQASVQKHVLRQAYDAELRIVDPSGRGLPTPVNFAEINRRLSDALLKDFFIAVSVAGTRADDIRRALTEALNQRGFAISNDQDKASVLARGTVEIKPIDQNVSGWKFVRWSAYFDLVDRNGGAVFGSVQRSGKEGHLSVSQAEDRAVLKIRKTLAADISEDLKKYILSQGNPTD